MDEDAPGSDMPAAPERVGDILRAMRERQGLSLAEVASRTRVPQRHLEAIEVGDYTGLPSITYATGFARAYARTIGADEVEVARGVRAELAGVTRPQRPYQPYEATDPARVPAKGLAMMALGLALVLAVLAGLYFATDLFRSGRGASPATEVATVTPDPAIAAAPAPAAAVAPAGQVLVTATDEVWVRIYDGGGKTLHQGVLQAGQRFDVPAGATDPMINVGRPDKIVITLNGSQLQGLDLGADPIKDVRVSAEALQARAAGRSPQPAPAASPTPPSTNTASSREQPRTARAETEAKSPAAQTRRSSERSRSTPALSETQRANLAAAPIATAATPPPTDAQ
ncbi:MAG: helix-turn-helix protein [Sphingomonas bacterium]|uniref:helix-turn-helix domain-containing protein n=1 Tax=Sphingomonas bacterium TaxID=1895847 RepID=UPI002623E495|nr:helix-turn-helix domain-containing protein [Sphingomonas bacterium]MDB5697080.1 helix-turn-helix protein [Sphingomonas bacterium]